MSIGIVAKHSKYKDLYGEKNLSFSVTYENERISIKKTAYLTQYVCYISPVWSMGRFIARFIGSTVNGFLPLSYIGMCRPIG